MDLQESEVRDGANDQERTVRMKWNHQYIFNTTLKGEHSFLRADRLKLDWTGVFSKAYSTTPDNAPLGAQQRQGYRGLHQSFLPF